MVTSEGTIGNTRGNYQFHMLLPIETINAISEREGLKVLITIKSDDKVMVKLAYHHPLNN